MSRTNAHHPFTTLSTDELRDRGRRACIEADVNTLNHLCYEAQRRKQKYAHAVLKEIVQGLAREAWPSERALFVYDNRCFWQTSMIDAVA